MRRHPYLIWVRGTATPHSGSIPIVVVRETEESWIGFNVEHRRDSLAHWFKSTWVESDLSLETRYSEEEYVRPDPSN